MVVVLKPSFLEMSKFLLF